MGLYLGQINEAEFLKQYFNGTEPSKKQVLHLIEQAIAGKDGEMVEEVVVLLCTEYFDTDSFPMLLCQLLKVTWNTKHEDIGMLLNQIKYPKH
jgi:hypothetical protein